MCKHLTLSQHLSLGPPPCLDGLINRDLLGGFRPIDGFDGQSLPLAWVISELVYAPKCLSQS